MCTEYFSDISLILVALVLVNTVRQRSWPLSSESMALSYSREQDMQHFSSQAIVLQCCVCGLTDRPENTGSSVQAKSEIFEQCLTKYTNCFGS